MQVLPDSHHINRWNFIPTEFSKTAKSYNTKKWINAEDIDPLYLMNSNDIVSPLSNEK